MKEIAFESKKFCQLRTLSERWGGMAIDRLIKLGQKGVIKLWHPEGRPDLKGRLVDVQSVLEAEEKGYLAPNDIN